MNVLYNSNDIVDFFFIEPNEGCLIKKKKMNQFSLKRKCK
jgi:hypothetical protein